MPDSQKQKVPRDGRTESIRILLTKEEKEKFSAFADSHGFRNFSRLVKTLLNLAVERPELLIGGIAEPQENINTFLRIQQDQIGKLVEMMAKLAKPVENPDEELDPNEYLTFAAWGKVNGMLEDEEE